jgi:hypothetical protein
MNTDTIYSDLKTVQKAKWAWSKNRRKTFDKIMLLGHPEIERRAADPSSQEDLLKALLGLLKDARDRLAAKEGKRGNSVAKAVGILLRLDRKNDRRPVYKLQDEVADVWNGDNDNKIVGNTVRLHYEEEHILRPFADELLAFLERFSAPGGSAGKEEEMLRHLRQVEEDRLQSIPREGKLEIRDDDEMLAVLRGVNNLASEALQAVDRTPIEHWFEDRLKDYLDEQLELVRERGLSLERIYLVRKAALKDDAERGHLIDFIRRHEEVSAVVLLCPAEMAGKDFNEEKGMVLADAEGEPMAVTGKLKDGEIGEARLYTRAQLDVDKLLDGYRRLRSRILTNHYDDKLREELGLPRREGILDVH